MTLWTLRIPKSPIGAIREEFPRKGCVMPPENERLKSSTPQGQEYPSSMWWFGDPGPLPRWLWLAVAAIVAVFVGLIVLGVGETVFNVLFAVAVCAFLLFIAPKVVEQMGGSDALGRPKTKDE
jgi:hypothetical protein